MTDAQQKVVSRPPPPTTVLEESATLPSKQFRRKKCVIVTVGIITFLVVDVLLFAALDLTLLRVRKPNYRLQSVTIHNLHVSNSTMSAAAAASFDMRLNAQATLRNRNFGSYTFHDGYLTFYYGGARVGEAVITESGVKMRSTKIMEIMVNLSSKGVPRNPRLGRDIESGFVRITADSDLRGQVQLVSPRDKSTKMNCDMNINLVKRVGQDLICD